MLRPLPWSPGRGEAEGQPRAEGERTRAQPNRPDGVQHCRLGEAQGATPGPTGVHTLTTQGLAMCG